MRTRSKAPLYPDAGLGRHEAGEDRTGIDRLAHGPATLRDLFLGLLKRPLRFAMGLLRDWVVRSVMNTHHCHGDPGRLHLGERTSTVNTVFNTSSGDIYVGDDTIFGHNCMVLTGRHEFINGQRREIALGESEIPRSGYDIKIGRGCWVASGAIIVGGVTIGDNAIVAAGAVVTGDVRGGAFVAGVPTRELRRSSRDRKR